MPPFSIMLDLDTAVIKDLKRVQVRRASDMKGYYTDEKALDTLIAKRNDPVHYSVAETPVPHEYGHPMYCISTLQPGKIGNEYFFTKSHYHTIAQTAEIYVCLAGEG